MPDEPVAEDGPSEEDLAMMKRWEDQQKEADALIADPDVHTPTAPPDDADDAG
jgi:hypothetical protein